MRGQPNDSIPVDEAKQVLEKALTIMTRNHIMTHYCSNGTIGNILRKKHHTVDHTTISRLRQAIHDWEGIL